MAVVLRLTAHAPLRCRFAISPVNETLEALRSLTHPSRESYHLPWQRQVRPMIADLELAPLLALIPAHSYGVDFTSPPPAGPYTEIESELARIRTTPPARVLAEIGRCARGQRPTAARRQVLDDLLADPQAARGLVAELLERAWRALILPWWPRLRDVLDADVTVRARQLADSGVAAVLGDLHPKIRWDNGDVQVQVSGPRQFRTLSDDGIILLPSVFAWPRVGVMLDPPWPPTIAYPARGIAEVWSPPRRGEGDLARLLGGTRATVLTALAEPASTGGLAARCELPVSSVSEHLTVLRANGLVSTVRAGRFLVHRQTALGVALAATSPPEVV